MAHVAISAATAGVAVTAMKWRGKKSREEVK
jgi:hypothetical protein